MRVRVVAVAVLLLLAAGARLLVAPLAAQSLAAVAKQEEERRKAIRQPAKVLTNKDLGSVPAAPASAAPKADAAKDTTKDAKATAKDEAADEQSATKAGPEVVPVVKDQAYWSSHLQALQAQLDRNQTYADAMQTRVNVLSADFVNRDDPAQRTVIANDRQKALDELVRLNKQISADKKAITDFLEDARRAGVPPGWLR